MSGVYVFLICLLVVAVVCDLRRREIPDSVSLVIAVSGVVLASCGLLPVTVGSSVLGVVCGCVVGSLAFVFAGFGGGDAKLVGSVGAWLGVWGLFTALFWVAITGMLLAFLAAARGHKDYAYAPAILVGVTAFLIRPDGISEFMAWIRQAGVASG
jgi:prepilin peptidase CpaA